MVTADADRFRATVMAMGAALGGATWEIDTPTLRLYWRALAHVPIDLVEAGAARWTQGGRWMAKPDEWLAACDQVELERAAKATQPPHARTLPALVPATDGATRRVWYHDCDVCEDSGWRFVHLDTGEQLTIEQAQQVGTAYRGARPCECRATNPTYQRRNPPPKAASYRRPVAV